MDRPHVHHLVRQGAALPTLDIGFRQPLSEPALTQDQRLAWIAELLTGGSESLPYRIAGLLLLVFGQPLVRVAELRADQVVEDGNDVWLHFGPDPVPVPSPFAELLLDHRNDRPNLRTGNLGTSTWLFPSTRTGQHLHPNTIMDRLRDLGIDLLGARNRTMRDLVAEVPAPIVADLLGYRYQVTERHAAAAGLAFRNYVGANSAPGSTS